MDNKKTDKETKDNRRNNKKKKSHKSNSVLNKGKVKDILELLDIKDVKSDYDTTINKDDVAEKNSSLVATGNFLVATKLFPENNQNFSGSYQKILIIKNLRNKTE